MNPPKPSAEGLAARRAALQMLDAVLRRGRTLDAAAESTERMSAPDHGLALAIAGEALRRIPDLDALIDSATSQRLPDDSKARMVLRLALAQKAALQTPDHAVVSTALPLVDGGPRRLVHGVLGTLLRRGVPRLDEPRLPATVEARWTRAWGDEAVHAARRQIAARPPLDLTFADDSEAQAFAAALGGRSLAARHVRLTSRPVAGLSGFSEGRWWVQDLASSLAARLVPSGAAELLDLCAAPGGKTMQLAAAGHRVTSVDSSGSRLARLAENLRRTGLSAELVAADAHVWEPGRTFDAILLDAPCSATGTFRRHPEVLHRVRGSFIVEAADAQTRLLTRASGWLAPGGVLVYSVCSLEPEEGEQVVAGFVEANPDFVIEPPRASELPSFVTPHEQGWLRVVPGLIEGEGGLDGFFTARLVRNR